MFKFATGGDEMKVVAIAPYNGLKEVIQSVKNKVNHIDMDIEIGDLEEGVKRAKEAEAKGADIIISRGGTARLIQKNVKIPVIEIEVSAYDLLRVFTLIKDSAEKKAIVGFGNVIESAKTISNLIDMEISAYTIEQEKDVVPKLKELQRNGYQIIVGDTITVHYAEALGLNGLLLTSGRESVHKALEDAVKFEKIYVPKKNKQLLPKALLDQHKKAFLIIDRDREVIYRNKQAQHIKDAINDSDLKRWIHELTTHKELKTLLEYNDEVLGLEGYFLSFDHSELICLEITIEDKQAFPPINGLKIINTASDNPLQTLNWFTANNNIMKDVIAKAKTFTLKDENVLIHGEVGTGKERLASLMHIGSNRSSYPLLVVDCEVIESDGWNQIFGDSGIIFNHLSGTVYLKKIDKLSPDNQKQLLVFMERDIPKPRFISSSTETMEQQIETEKFLYELYLVLSPLKIQIPPLRDREEDFETLVKLFINKFNYEYGREIAGIRPAALELLQKKAWLQNIDELIQFMKEVILIAKGPFINVEDVQNIEEKHALKFPVITDFPMDKSLKEIELAIIKKVFKEENENHSQTAKRLGINRSTLWRKLKDK